MRSRRTPLVPAFVAKKLGIDLSSRKERELFNQPNARMMQYLNEEVSGRGTRGTGWTTYPEKNPVRLPNVRLGCA